MFLLLSLFLSFSPTTGTKDAVVYSDTLYLEEACVKENRHHAGVLDGSRIRSNIGRSSPNLLQEISSVYVKNYGAGQLSTLAIRGTNASQSLVSWNGINLNSVFLGQSDLSQFPVGLHQAYELDLSPNGGIIGGRFNLISRPIFEPRTEWRFTGRYGSFGTYSNLFDLSFSNRFFFSSTRFFHQQSRNDFDYVNPSEPGQSRKKTENGAWQQLSVIQDVGFKINRHISLQASVWYNRSQRQIPSMFIANNQESQRDENLRGQLMLSAEWKKHRLSVSSSVLHDQLLYINPAAAIEADSRSLSIRSRANWQYRPLAFLYVQLELGADQERANTDGYEKAEKRNIFFGDAMFTVDIPGVKNLQLQSGYRHERVGTLFSPAMPYMQLRWQYSRKNHQGELKWKGGRNFRAPTLNDLFWREGGNRALLPEKSWNTELSSSWSPGKYFTTSITGYYMHVDNYIQWVPKSNGLWSPENIKTVNHLGLEWNISGQIRNSRSTIRFTYFTSYSLCHTFSGGDISSQLIYVPRHKINAFAELSVYDFFFKPQISYTGSRETQSNNRTGTALPAYGLLQMEIGKTFYLGPHELMGSFSIQNITNTSYQEIAGRPMRGRAFECTLRLRFSHEKQ